MEIQRFGPGFRRRAPGAGSQGLADQIIWSDPRARVTELALSRRAVMAPQTSPDLGLFIVISGGGWVQVGEERVAINHGEAVEWPPGITHGAWTDGSEMRAILIELPDQAIDASHVRISAPGAESGPTAAQGGLADRHVRPEEHDDSEGEPW
ncbi:MAG: cupin domain-containing protein [Chloroflexota bacterium]